MSKQAPRRALIVIDVQNEYVTGNFRIEYPPVESSLPNIGKAIDAANAHGVPVVLVQHVLPADAPIFAKDSDGARLHPVVADRPHDHVVTKVLPSAFSGAGFDDWLKEHKIDTLTVIGYMTQNCNDATMREAMHKGYVVEFLPDAAGSLSYKNKAGYASAEEMHRIISVIMESTYAATMSTKEWVENVNSPTPVACDNIYSSNLRAHGKV
ncbi:MULTISPECIES: cysteine hydrolase family protein [Pseudomonadota]|jgi:nicotinamidase-related amidase|uniref:cysteine hydrolase family protein n=1 Tax=Pseudomonadota TaxID=1224 RepID=UPI000947739A|nr:cysteine hydrolase family protein [Paraburkholderia sp. SOS3]APR38444.1 cysteine hydrolase [Paraburkholderia sp. SOS3]